MLYTSSWPSCGYRDVAYSGATVLAVLKRNVQLSAVFSIMVNSLRGLLLNQLYDGLRHTFGGLDRVYDRIPLHWEN